MKKTFPIFAFSTMLLIYSCKKDESRSSTSHQLIYQLKIDTIFTSNVISNFHFIWNNVGNFSEDAEFLNSIHSGINNSLVKVVNTGDFISLYSASNITSKFSINLLMDGNIVQTSPIPTFNPNIPDSTYTTKLTYVIP